jgi:phospholipid/cholesterol/gamma-HCH transport system substrate-binding protein
LAFSYQAANVSTVDGYEVTADFSGIGGLKKGDDVQISGVKVGSVKNVELVPESYLAKVTISVNEGIKLPADTGALISSESLLGGRYLALEPGADEDRYLKAGDRIEWTQAPQNLEQLLGQFIFSQQNSDNEKPQ